MKTLFAVFLIVFSLENAFAQRKIKFIVNATNDVSRLTENQLQDFFLKRARQWPDGTPLRFFDRGDDSPERLTFLREYIKRTPRQIEQHWIGQKLYSGDAAPSQVPSDALVASLVARFPGGISYVSSDFKGAKGVKVVEVIGD